MKYRSNALIQMLVVGMALLLITQSCITNRISADTSTKVLSTQESSFSPNDLAMILRQTYYNFDVPVPQSALDLIQNSSSEEDAKKAYDSAIDEFIDSGVMSAQLRLIGRQMLGTINSAGNPASRYAENLFAYVITHGLPISELILATYAIDDNDEKVSAEYTDNSNNIISPPDDAKAGYLTYDMYLSQYLTASAFRMDREIIGIHLCDTAPYSKFESFSWKVGEVNSKYRVADDGMSCVSCHAKKNPLRGAWHGFTISTRLYNPVRPQSQDQYGQELIGSSGSTLEPRINETDQVMPAAEAESTMYRFKENGPAILTPRALAKEIIKEPRFGQCWTERLLAIFLNLNPGSPGQGFTPPNNFSSSDEQIAFLNKWAEKFNDEKQVPQEWIRSFLKDMDYLTLSRQPKP